MTSVCILIGCSPSSIKGHTSELYIYISGVRSSGHRVKPNMADNGGPNLRHSQSPYAVFHVYVYSKNGVGELKPT